MFRSMFPSTSILAVREHTQLHRIMDGKFFTELVVTLDFTQGPHIVLIRRFYKRERDEKK